MNVGVDVGVVVVFDKSTRDWLHEHGLELIYCMLLLHFK